MMKKVWLMLAVLVCIFASCSDGGSDNPVDPTPKPEEVKTEITIDSGIVSNGLSFGATEGEQSVSFSVNANWTLSVASTTSGITWCKASATSGSKGTANVKFTVSENTDYEDRSVSVTIKAGTVSKTFTITQKGADALLVTTAKYEVPQEGGQIEVEVKANIDYQIEISEDANSWITESKSKSRAMKTTIHKFEIALNEEAEKREGEITFKSGDKVEVVNVYQAGGTILLLSQNEYTVSDAGDTISVDIKSNVEYGVQLPDVDWITDEASTRGMSSHTLKYIIAANEEYDTRSAEVIFYDKNSDLKDTLKVVQIQKDAIIVAKNEYTIDAVGGDLKFEVNTNVDFEVSASVDWIKQNTESRALEAKPLNFTIAENTTDEAREGGITISSGELKQEIKVIQKAKTVFSLSETEFNIASEGGDIIVEVSTNGEYTITLPEVDWLKENESRATSTFTHTFTVIVNETYNAREAEITFTHNETSEVVKLKVVQAQKDAIVISQKEYNVKAEGETIEVKLSANIDFEVIAPDVNWISQIKSRRLNEHTLYFKIDENSVEESRSEEIVFMNKKSQISESVKVNQEKALKAGYENGVVSIAVAGSMKKLLGDDYLNITSLKVKGPISGDDIYLLRKMLGCKAFNEENIGKLTTLDLSEASIVNRGGNQWYMIDVTGEYHYPIDNQIGEYMFSDCCNLTNIYLPNNLISIEESAFSRCVALEKIYLPNTITSIGTSAFNDCEALKYIHIESLMTWLKIDFKTGSSNPLYSTDNSSRELYIGDKLLSGKLVIPNEIEEVKNHVFNSYDYLTEVIIHDQVLSIGDNAFQDCELTSVYIGKNVKLIGEAAFASCSLDSLILSDNVYRIDAYAFSNCNKLKKVKLGKEMRYIGKYAFYNNAIIELYSYSTSAPNLNGGTVTERYNIKAFENGVKKEAKLYIPNKCLSSYRKQHWDKYFENIIEMD